MKTKQTPALRAIAQIKSVFGIRGEVKIFSYARTAEEFKGLDSLFMGKDETETVLCSIESVRERGDNICLKFRDIDDRTAAEDLRGKYLFVEASRQKQLSPEKFYVDDLVGCAVIDERGQKLGIVSSVDALPAQMLYTVKSENGEVMLPAVKEFILSVDVVKKEIVVRPPEGLFSGKMLE